jgi:hypothetical protein
VPQAQCAHGSRGLDAQFKVQQLNDGLGSLLFQNSKLATN